MARIERDRDAALRRFKQDRDTTTLERTMKRLDAEEREAQASTQVISSAEAAAWLQDLPALWHAADDSGRRLLTEALFEKVEVLGVKSVTIHPTPEVDAHGWSEAFGPTPQLIPVEMVAGAIGTDGRGERGRASLAHLRFRPRFRARERHSGGEILAGCLPKGQLMARQRPTRRQFEVLQAYIRAGSVASAAYDLQLSETTVRQHLSGLY